MFAADPKSPDVLPCVCALCRGPVDPNEGLLFVALSIDHMAPQPSAEGVPGEGPESADWRVAHMDCLPEVEGVSYGIELFRACTPRQLLLWTAHLSEKPWLANTKWMSLMRSVAEDARIDTGTWAPPPREEVAE